MTTITRIFFKSQIKTNILRKGKEIQKKKHLEV